MADGGGRSEGVDHGNPRRTQRSSLGADIVAIHLADANLAGDSSHGIQVPSCAVKDRRDGRVYPTSHVTTVHGTSAVAMMDGNLGLGKRHKERGRRSSWFMGCAVGRVDDRSSCPRTVSNR